MSLSEPPRDSVGRFIADPPEPPKTWPPTIWGLDDDLKEQRRIRVLSDRNARLEKTQECWGEVCNCSHRKK
jgi:hypothetical protein